MIYGSLFSGYGGLDLAVEAVTGATCAWHSEVDPSASKVLAHHWPSVPNLGDIEAVDWRDVPPVDLICGGFPCQDLSFAGLGAGLKEGTRSGLWFRCADAVRVLRPRYVFVENVAALLVRGLGTVLGDLAALGYRVRWGCVRASDAGAPHRRERLFILAACDAGACGWGAPVGDLLPWEPDAAGGAAADADRDGLGWVEGLPGGWDEVPPIVGLDADECGDGGGWPDRLAHFGAYAAVIARWEPIVGRCAPDPIDDRGRLNPVFVEWMMGLPEGWVTGHGLARTAELKMLGNGVVPQQGAMALSMLAPVPELVAS